MVNTMENQNVALHPVQGSAALSKPSSGGVDDGHSHVRASATSSAPESGTHVAPAYVSPKGAVDPESGIFVLQYRDTDTGEVRVQYPAQKVVSAYQDASVAPVTSPVGGSSGNETASHDQEQASSESDESTRVATSESDVVV